MRKLVLSLLSLLIITQINAQISENFRENLLSNLNLILNIHQNYKVLLKDERIKEILKDNSFEELSNSILTDIKVLAEKLENKAISNKELEAKLESILDKYKKIQYIKLLILKEIIESGEYNHIANLREKIKAIMMPLIMMDLSKTVYWSTSELKYMSGIGQKKSKNKLISGNK